MSTEPIQNLELPHPKLEKLWNQWLKKKPERALEIHVKSDGWEQLSGLLLNLRTEGLASVVLVEPTLVQEEHHDEFLERMSFLRTWDQLLLKNILAVRSKHFPEAALKWLAQEAKLELVWFKEWHTASINPEIAKIPNLPWRKFLRKTNTENWELCLRLEEKIEEAWLKDYLLNKQKTINIFPKNWKETKIVQGNA